MSGRNKGNKMINRYFSCESVAAVNELRERIETQTMANHFGKIASVIRSLLDDERKLYEIKELVNDAMTAIVNNMSLANARIAELEAEND